MIRILFALLLLSSCSNPPNVENTLSGTYELIEWKGTRLDSSIVYPYGESAQGIIMYDSKGNMSMQLQKDERDELGTDDYESLDSETILNAYQGFFSYYGKYSVEGEDKVIHDIEGCKNPDWVGRKLTRRFTIVEDRLILRSDSVIGMDHILTWRRL